MAALPRAPELVTVTTPGGVSFRVAKAHHDKFQGLVNDLEASGYVLNPKTSGGFNSRYIAGTTTPSRHAFGEAVDVNWDENPRGGRGKIPSDVARAVAAKHGMVWGGDWKNPDDMHFEVARTRQAAVPAVAANSARGEYGVGQRAVPDVPAMAAKSAAGEYGVGQTGPDVPVAVPTAAAPGPSAADFAELADRYRALAASQGGGGLGGLGDMIANIVKAGQTPVAPPEPILQRPTLPGAPIQLAQRLR